VTCSPCSFIYNGKNLRCVDFQWEVLNSLCFNVSELFSKLCGLSGVIAQQMLVLPFDAKKPALIPFLVTHLILAGTRSVVHENAGLKIPPLVPSGTRTLEEKKAIALRVASALVDPKWRELNNERFQYIYQRAINPK